MVYFVCMFTAPSKNEKSEVGKSGEAKEDKSSDEEEDFLGFSPSTDKVSYYAL